MVMPIFISVMFPQLFHFNDKIINNYYRNTVASASADKLVKIWDVATGKCNITMEHHTDKVILKALSLRNTCLVTP